MINSFKGEYFFLSNFYECPVVYDGLCYQNNEAAFQAQKCTKAEDKKMFTTLNPSEAKKLGRRISLRKDWERVKLTLMKEIVSAKFEQNPNLAQKLIATGDAHLEEGNDWNDRIWGTVNGVGANHLGIILMQVREEMKSHAQDKDKI
ncbi:MAG: NADAR family protein [Ruminococcus sp.]|nr:NADAR family protein [Ruminococcus sp.]